MSLARRNDGCHECCKRRIKCDKTEPECLKCQKKGIACSGQGIRCRFSSHMGGDSGPSSAASRRRQKDVSAAGSQSTFQVATGVQQVLPSRTKRSAKPLKWVEVGTPAKKKRPQARRNSPPAAEGSSSSMESLETIPDDPVVDLDDVDEDFSTLVFSDESFCANQLTLWSSPNDVMHPQERMLFNHFCDEVAPVMVVLDSMSNGYKNVILPLACQDQVLGRAVSVVSAFHLAQKIPAMKPAAEAGHLAIVEKLRRDSLQLDPGQLFNPYTLATILVLLVGETITGTSNYTYLLEMLGCLTQSPDFMQSLPEGLRQFFQEQIKMFKLFGFPLSNEQKGLQILTQSADDYLEFMSYPSIPTSSEHYHNLQAIRSAIQDACNIYRRRASDSIQTSESIHMVEQMRQKVQHISASTKGAHALVWAYFIAAAESILPEHREFFTDRLLRLYGVTKFGSIPLALQALGNIWMWQGMRKWTEVVINETPILIM